MNIELCLVGGPGRVDRIGWERRGGGMDTAVPLPIPPPIPTPGKWINSDCLDERLSAPLPSPFDI